MTEYRAEVKKLAEKVMEVMDENLGLPIGYIKRAFNSHGSTSDIHSDKSSGAAFFGTKVSHYPACPEPEKVMGLRAHTDAGGVILLYQDEEVKGLQILKDDTWIDVQPLPSAIVVNTGDQIEVLSNGRYKSVWHRVLAQPNGTRRSIASFYNPCLKATIAPVPMLLHEVGLKLEQQLKADDDDHKFVRPNGIGASTLLLPERTSGKNTATTTTTTYPKFQFGDYMSVYAAQKFLPKEPRFEAVRAM